MAQKAPAAAVVVDGEFRMDKETKGTVRYAEVKDPPTVGTVYISKFSLPQPYPKTVHVTITAGE